jgi:tRNA(adenine34) deaminase
VTDALRPDPQADDERFMDAALEEARRAGEKGEVPVGSVIVYEGHVVARGHNLREATQDPTAHAELLALKEAARALGTWRLSGATCYVTLEPCPMCAGALVNARIDRVVFAADDPKAGATTTLYPIGSDSRLNHRFALTGGVRKDEASRLLKDFFARLRQDQKSGRAILSTERAQRFRSAAAAEVKRADEHPAGEGEDEGGEKDDGHGR